MKWYNTLGEQVFCSEKIKILQDGLEDVTNSMQNFIEDCMLMGIDYKSTIGKIMQSFNAEQNMPKKINNCEIILPSPRGFCAGVTRAIGIVEAALEKFGSPIYVNHEIVHNIHVVAELERKGVVFLSNINDAPIGANVIYSAHGVSDYVEQIAKDNSLNVLDATCPLVKKVHREVIEYDSLGLEIILIGHKNHPEMIGTSGRIRDSQFVIIETLDEAKKFIPKNSNKLAMSSQTTLSVSDTKDITEYLLAKFPAIQGFFKNDICYATQNRQDAVNALIQHGIDVLIVVGSMNSSNSNRLKDIGSKHNIRSYLMDTINDVIINKILTDLGAEGANKGTLKIGLTAGASAPESLVQTFIEFISSRCEVSSVVEIVTTVENIVFPVPPKLMRQTSLS